METTETPFELKSCYDCGHLKSAVSWWCGSKEAIAARGTQIPGCIHCPFWKPDWKMIPKKYKTLENGYVKKLTFWQKLKRCLTLTDK